MSLGKITPVLRIFDEAKAREFYIDFLGFKVDWEHRLEDGLPHYMQVSKDDCILHLSDHFGDGCPGMLLRIDTTDLKAYQQQLLAKKYKHARPGIERQPWNRDEMTIHDAFGNQLIFSAPVEE